MLPSAPPKLPATVRRVRLSYANVTSSIALFLALGGTSYAVAKLPKNSVGDQQLRSDAVTSPKIKDGTITAADLARGVVGSGPRGPRGSQGTPGVAGERGPSDLYVGTGETKSFPTTANTRIVVARVSNLPAGKYLLRGSARVSNWYSPLAGAHCWLFVNGDMVGRAYLPLGSTAGAVHSGPMAPEGHATVLAGASATMECFFDSSVTTATEIEVPRLTALRVENVVVQNLP